MRPFLVPLLLLLAVLTAVVRAQDDTAKPPTPNPQLPTVTVIVGATLINPTGAAVPNVVIVINGSRIISVGRVPLEAGSPGGGPAGAQVIDARGKFVIPGLADMHNHLEDGGISREQNLLGNLGRILSVGVTTVLDPSVPEADFTRLKAAAEADSSPYARFFGTGPGLTAEGDQLGAQNPKPTTVADAQAVVQKLKALNVDAVKVIRDDLTWASTRRMEPMKVEVLQAVVDEAHRHGLKVFAHAPQLQHAKEALRAGVDGLLHGILDDAVDADFLALMRRTAPLTCRRSGCSRTLPTWPRSHGARRRTGTSWDFNRPVSINSLHRRRA